MKKQKLSEMFMAELTLGKLVAFLIMGFGFTFSLGAGSIKLHSSMSQTATNKIGIDSILVMVDNLKTVTTSLDSNSRAIADFLKNGGHVPENLAYAPKDTNVYVAQAIYPKPKKEQKRACNSELSTIEKDFKD